MKIAFFGTPDFAAGILSGVLEFPEVKIVLVVSQSDKPVGRKRELLPTPVKRIAVENNISILQPEKVRKNLDFIEALKNLDLDFIVVVAYGKIIPQSILDIPKYGCINIHGSILPKYRGASPVQSALKDGVKETWLTIMYMDKKMDEGDILQIGKIAVDKDDTLPDLFAKMLQIWPALLIDTLKKILSGELLGEKQNHETATYCGKFTKEDGEVLFSSESTQEIYNKFRAFYEWPGIYTYYEGKKLNLEEVSLHEPPPQSSPYEGGKKAWSFIKLNKKTYGIACVDKKILLLHEVKLEGKKSMDIVSFVNGNRGILDYKCM